MKNVNEFEELAKYHSLSLMKWDEYIYVSENTQLAKDFYEAGQQSKQNDIEELENIIKVISDTADWHIEDCACSHPISQRELGWLEAMSLIKEKLGDYNAL